MNQLKKNSENAMSLSMDLQQKVEIDQKLDYYKSILKAYDELGDAIKQKIESLEEFTDAESVYKRNKLVIEGLENSNSIFEKKKFFEMWLSRSTEYDRKFAIITKECNDTFDELQAEARELAENNLQLKSYMDKYDKEENTDQKTKNEYYLLLKYQVSRIKGKGKFTEA